MRKVMITSLVATALAATAFYVLPKEPPAFDKIGMMIKSERINYQGVQKGTPLADLFGARSQ